MGPLRGGRMGSFWGAGGGDGVAGEIHDERLCYLVLANA